MAPQMAPFYRFWLPTLDPIVAFTGVLANVFAQSTILNSYNASFPSTAKHVPTEAAVCLETIAGSLLATLFLQVVLLRARWNDLTVWRCVQLSILIVDLAMLGAMSKALYAQGRLSLIEWRWEEWTNMGITGGVALIRVAFLLGIGVKGQGKVRKA